MKNVVITGIGIKSCIGNTYKDVLSNLQNGMSGIAFNEKYSEMGFRSCVSGSIDINLSDLIDRKLLRFMGCVCLRCCGRTASCRKDKKLCVVFGW